VSELNTRRVRVVVSGDVQGVGFRWSCRQQAGSRGVGGFVRNLPDGRVEAVFEGPSGALDALVAWCRTGPAWGRVEAIEVFDETAIGETAFRIAGSHPLESQS
jgi:acylphosphatase